MPHTQCQPTDPLSEAKHRCRNNQIIILPFLVKFCQIYLYTWAYWPLQSSSNKTLLVWNIWQNLSQTVHKTPCYRSGRQLWCANGRGLNLAPTTEFPTWLYWGGQCGDRFMMEVCGMPDGWYTPRGKWNKGISVKLGLWCTAKLFPIKVQEPELFNVNYSFHHFHHHHHLHHLHQITIWE